MTHDSRDVPHVPQERMPSGGASKGPALARHSTSTVWQPIHIKEGVTSSASRPTSPAGRSTSQKHAAKGGATAPAGCAKGGGGGARPAASASGVQSLPPQGLRQEGSRQADADLADLKGMLHSVPSKAGAAATQPGQSAPAPPRLAVGFKEPASVVAVARLPASSAAAASSAASSAATGPVSSGSVTKPSALKAGVGPSAKATLRAPSPLRAPPAAASTKEEARQEAAQLPAPLTPAQITTRTGRAASSTDDPDPIACCALACQEAARLSRDASPSRRPGARPASPICDDMAA